MIKKPRAPRQRQVHVGLSEEEWRILNQVSLRFHLSPAESLKSLLRRAARQLGVRDDEEKT